MGVKQKRHNLWRARTDFETGSVGMLATITMRQGGGESKRK